MFEVVTNLFADINILFIVKIIILVVILLTSIFALFLTTQVQSLNRLVTISHTKASLILQLLTLIYLFLVISLFITTIAIL